MEEVGRLRSVDVTCERLESGMGHALRDIRHPLRIGVRQEHVHVSESVDEGASLVFGVLLTVRFRVVARSTTEPREPYSLDFDDLSVDVENRCAL